MNGLISFNVLEGILSVVTQRGILTSISRESQGVFPIVMPAQEEQNYQVSVSDDEHPISWWITNRSTTGFTLNVGKTTGGFLDPDTLCTVSIELPPPAE